MMMLSYPLITSNAKLRLRNHFVQEKRPNFPDRTKGIAEAHVGLFPG